MQQTQVNVCTCMRESFVLSSYLTWNVVCAPDFDIFLERWEHAGSNLGRVQDCSSDERVRL
jgi:hypothetical protein